MQQLPRTLALPPVPVRISLREQVAQALRAAAVAGQLRPDTVYSAPTIAAQFGVSLTPVREAVLDLAKEGLVEVMKNKGFRICPVTGVELDEITQIRALLEIPTVAGLTGRLRPTDLDQLRILAQAIVDSARAGDVVAYIDADLAFHRTLLDLAGNVRLTDIVTDLRNRSRLYGLHGLAEQGLLADSAAEHHTLVDLLAGHDPEAVAGLMRTHLRHVRSIWAGEPEPVASAPRTRSPRRSAGLTHDAPG